ncbi:hypothetical protein ONZ45_g4439 [Pleurotus djamor]|nr:hypothetical protein ONZ45_g4439 [Pleurotus djamor]
MTNKPYVQPGEPLNDFLRAFWQRQVDAAEQETPDYRHPPLPLARIKKVMKSDPDVKMIAADAPILFCKACEIFISEITARAFIIADSNKRRTLSRSDIAKALSKSDQFDFLIDIVPRDELSFPASVGSNGAKKAGMPPKGKQKADSIPTTPDPNAPPKEAYEQVYQNDPVSLEISRTLPDVYTPSPLMSPIVVAASNSFKPAPLCKMSRHIPPEFQRPSSLAVDHVNPLIGNGGVIPSHTGGMIPSTAPPFAMTRWVAQTRQNYVSVPPYIFTDTSIHGFQGTHQPAIWMGESGQVVVVPGAGQVRSEFEARGMVFDKASEITTASYYSVELNAVEGGKILAEQSATSRVGHLRFTFEKTAAPFVIVEATRAAVVGHTDPSNVTLHIGSVQINPGTREICGSNPERQDSIIGPLSTPARGFSGFFCARFNRPFTTWGVTQNGTIHKGVRSAMDQLLSGFATFAPSNDVIDVRVGVSFISIDQARRNLLREIPDGTSLEETARTTRAQWAEKLDRIQIEGATKKQMDIFYTGFFHALQYPYETSEEGRYYSGFDDQVHEGDSYNGYSIWDTYRAEWAWLILFAPERMPGMITSMLNDFQEVRVGGWLPKWKNIVGECLLSASFLLWLIPYPIETNIMVGTHADSQIAEAVVKGIRGFDLDLAWEAVIKDATVPPIHDDTVSYGDREENVDYEARAGLSTVYASRGWVANNMHSEAGSRTLDYAYDDYAIGRFAQVLNKTDAADFYLRRGLDNPFKLFNQETGFMETRNADGSLAGPDAGWTEGDKWIYTFDVVQNVPGLARRKGGNASLVKFLDEHFDGGHNQHTNEVGPVSSSPIACLFNNSLSLLIISLISMQW